MSIIIPPYLHKGDTIGMVCPAGYLPAEKTKKAIETIENIWVFKVRVGKTVGHQHHYFSGTDAERLADLQDMMDDPQIKAILCGRGGYGTGRIIDQLDFTAFCKHPKWVIGFSDITVLHSHVLTQYGIASLHAPMANAFNDGGDAGPYVRSLQDALEGRSTRFSAIAHPFNKQGEATGILLGGNLSLIAHLVGTPSDIDTRGAILFLEDVGEYIYNIDRMMYQLKRSGKLDHLAGLIFGGFTDCKDTTLPFGQTVEEVLRAHVKEYNYPVCFGFPVSHDTENYALKTGCDYKLIIGANEVTLENSPILLRS